MYLYLLQYFSFQLLTWDMIMRGVGVSINKDEKKKLYFLSPFHCHKQMQSIFCHCTGLYVYTHKGIKDSPVHVMGVFVMNVAVCVVLLLKCIILCCSNIQHHEKCFNIFFNYPVSLYVIYVTIYSLYRGLLCGCSNVFILAGLYNGIYCNMQSIFVSQRYKRCVFDILFYTFWW